MRASQWPARCPCCASLRLSRALLFERGHGTGCWERALKVLSSDCDVDNIRATMITRWHNTHANLDPTNSPTQSELRGDVQIKVCTRVLLHRAPLPPLPDPFIPMPQLVDDAAMGSKSVNWSCLAPHCRRVCDMLSLFAPTTMTDGATPCEKAASSRGVPPEGRLSNRAFCADLPCWTVCVATCVSTLAQMAT